MPSLLKDRTKLEKILALICILLVALLVTVLLVARSVNNANMDESLRPQASVDPGIPAEQLHRVKLDDLRGSTVDAASAKLKIPTDGNTIGIRTLKGYVLPGNGTLIAPADLGSMIVTAVCVDDKTSGGATLYVGAVSDEKFTPEVRAAALSSNKQLNKQLGDLANCHTTPDELFVKND